MNNSIVTFQTSQGLEARGELLSLERYRLTFALHDPATVLRVSEVLNSFKVLMAGRLVYSGQAVITSLVNSGTSLVCEARLEDVWVDEQDGSASLTIEGVNGEFADFFGKWQEHYRISREYRLFVSELHSFFHDLRLWLDHMEMKVRSLPAGNRQQFEHELGETLGKKALAVFQHFVERFESLAAGLDPKSVPAHQAYMRRQMHPLLFCSPWVYRTVSKPLGYAGDYEMVNMMVRDPLEGASLFAKVVNYCFMNQGPVIAHRNRINYLLETLVAEGLKRDRAQGGFRALSVGCGPAIEVQRFLKHGHLVNRASFGLLDFNEETLQYTRRAIADASRGTGHAPANVKLMRKSVQQIVKESARSHSGASEHYDLVYCAGLFDYLTDEICRRLTKVMFDWVAPGGLLVATNVAPSNPLRYGMEHMLDWNLVYRTSPQMLNLNPAGPSEEAQVRSDLTGTNIWLEVRKAGYG